MTTPIDAILSKDPGDWNREDCKAVATELQMVRAKLADAVRVFEWRPMPWAKQGWELVDTAHKTKEPLACVSDRPSGIESSFDDLESYLKRKGVIRNCDTIIRPKEKPKTLRVFDALLAPGSMVGRVYVVSSDVSWHAKLIAAGALDGEMIVLM